MNTDKLKWKQNAAEIGDSNDSTSQGERTSDAIEKKTAA